MKYQVEFYDYSNGAKSAIDTIEAPEEYTAEQYIKDCEANADPDFVDMLKGGAVELLPIETGLFYVIAIRGGDEFIEGKFDTLIEAAKHARRCYEKLSDSDKKKQKIEARQYAGDIEDENAPADAFDYYTFDWRLI